jgi:hypothetical protein
LREKEYAEITDTLNDIWMIIVEENWELAKDMTYKVRQKFLGFSKYKKHLFPDLQFLKFQGLDEALIKLMELTSKNQETDSEEAIQVVSRLQKEVGFFHKTMQENILNSIK